MHIGATEVNFVLVKSEHGRQAFVTNMFDKHALRLLVVISNFDYTKLNIYTE